MPGEDIPELLAGRYEVQEVLGEGPETAWLRVRDRLMPSRALRAKLGRGEGVSRRASRLLDEWRVLSDLRHPNLPEVIDFGLEVEGGWTWMIVVHVPGHALETVGVVAPADALDVAIDVARALQRLHESGLIHHDVKPSTVVWDPSSRTARLVDLDLAAPPGLGSGRGTLPYAAPEILAGEPVDHRADLFSLGVTLYHVLTGSPIDEANSRFELDVGGAASSALAELIAVLTREDPAARPDDAGQVLARLSRVEPRAADAWAERSLLIGHPPLIRRPEHEIATRYLDSEPVDGRVPVISVSGPEGVGRTRFVDGVARHARERGVRVLEVDGLCDGTLEPILRFLRRLEGTATQKGGLHGLLGDQGPGDWQGVFARIAQELVARVGARPTLLVLDDVQLHDETSRNFLLHLLRTVLHPPSTALRGWDGLRGIVASFEPGDLGPPELLEMLDGELATSVLTIRLSPFDVSQVDGQLAAMGVVTDDWAQLVQRVREFTGGNPSMIRELVLADLGDDGSTAPLAALVRGGADGAGAPVDLETIVRRRIERLGGDGIRLLQLVAIFPHGAAREELLALEGSGASREETIVRVVESGHLTEIDGVLRFRDATSRRVAEMLIGASERRTLHDLVAARLEVREAAREDRSWHLLHGHRPRLGLGLAVEVVPSLLDRAREEEAIRLLESVEARTETSVFGARWAALTLAEIHLRRNESARAAARVEPWIEREAGDFCARLLLSRIRRTQGRPQDARDLIEVLDPPPARLGLLDRLRITFEICEAMVQIGYTEEVWERLLAAGNELREAAPEIGMFLGAVPAQEDLESPDLPVRPDDMTEVVAHFLALLAVTSLWRADRIRALWSQMGVVRLRRRLGDERGHAQALHALGTIYTNLGHFPVAEANFERALSKRKWLGDLTGAAETANNLGVLMRRTGQLEQAKEYFRLCLEWVQRTGHARAEVNARLNLANVHNDTRELEDASREYDRALEVARRVGDFRSEAQILNNLGTVASLKGLHGEAIECYEHARRLDERMGNERFALNKCLNLAEESIAVGMLGEAERLLERVRDHAEDEEGADELRQRFVHAEARLLRGRGEHDRAARRLEEVRASYEGSGDQESLAALDSERADLKLDVGDHAGAAALLEPYKEFDPRISLPVVVARARLFRVTGRPEGIATFLTELEAAIRAARGANLLGQLFDLLRHRAVFALDAGQMQDCHEASTEALETLETIAFSIRDQLVLRSFLQSRRVREFREEIEDYSRRLREGSPRRMMAAAEPVFMRLRDALFDAQRRLGPAGHGYRSEVAIRRILEATRTLRSTSPLDTLLRDVVDQVVAFSRAERGFLVTLDARGRSRIAVARDANRQPISKPESEVSGRIVEQVLDLQRSTRRSAARNASRYASGSVVNHELRVMCAPLVHGGRTLGAIYVDNRSRKGQFTAGDLEFLDVFAAQAGIALENARLMREFARDERVKVMGSMAAGVAHGFNNILARILGRAQEMAMRCRDPELLAGLAAIEGAAREGAAVVEDLQDITHVRGDREPRVLRVSELVAEVVEVTRYRWEGEALRRGTRIQVGQDVPTDLHVRGRAVELRGALTDLVLHSVESLAGGGRVDLSAHGDGDDAVVLQIADSGPPMPEEIRRHILDPFLAVGGANSGTIGLSMVDDIIQAHRGTLEVVAGEDEGTILRVRLPRAEPVDGARETAPPEPVTGPVLTPTGRGRVLVVDDEPGVLDLLGEFLGRQGLDVRTATDGLEALRILDGFEPEVLLTDLGMAPLNGWDLAEQVKARSPQTRVILLTGWGAEIDEEMARERHVDRIMTKPFDLSELRVAIDEARALVEHG